MSHAAVSCFSLLSAELLGLFLQLWPCSCSEALEDSSFLSQSP